MMHPKLTKGTITHYCGTLEGTIVGGLQNMFSLYFFLKVTLFIIQLRVIVFFFITL